MKTLLLALMSALFLSCGKSGKEIKLYDGKKEDFSKFINARDMKNPNTNQDKTIRNNDYPIEIALYQNKRFYYDLPNLGDGTGTWKYENGFIRLTAKQKLFDMVIDLHGRDAKIENLAIKFSDRFGPKTLEATNEHFE